jgi:bacillithiol biosynthesis cysteine-adding enzyme BshC
VVEALAAQNARYEGSPARERNLALLAEGAEAVVTGQQVGLFLGPLFTTYKTATAIALARRLSKERGRPLVPVFWLQTEDHDLAEIATCRVAPSRGVSLHLGLPASEERISVAHRTLPEAVETRLHEMHDALSHLPFVEEHVGRLRRHYRPGARWGDAFAGVLAELFAEDGLVLLDPRDPALAPLAAPVHRRAIERARSIAEALKEQSAAETVHVREGSPLSFFHPDGPEAPRYRLTATDGGFAEVGGSRVHSEKEILEALEDRPMCFSTSALLRPILQDSWLATSAYVAGPAEARYFEQLPPVYEAFGLPMPRVVPRVHIRLLEPKTRRALASLGLTAEQASDREDAVLAWVAARAGDVSAGEALGRRLLATFLRDLDEMTPSLRGVGDGMDRSIEKTKRTVQDAVSRLTAQYAKMSSQRDQDRIEEVRRLVDWLFPDRQPQERVYGISYFAAKHGERAFLERVLATAAHPADEPVDLEL